MLVGLLAALGAAVVYGGAAILQAHGTRQVAGAHGLDLRFVLQVLREPAFLGALVLSVGGFFLHLVAIRTVPLYLAQSGIAASLVVTALLAAIVFGERLSRANWTAVGAVCVGLAVLGLASGEAGGSGDQSLLPWLWVGVVLILAAGLLVARLHSTLGIGLLSVLAGLGYTVVGVAGRELPALQLPSVLSSGALYVLMAGAAVAFLLYSIALQRGVVAVATAPMIALQTVGPALVGLAVLDDRVRDGWWPVAVLGFLLALAGAVMLVRFEAVAEPITDEPVTDEPAPGPVAG